MHAALRPLARRHPIKQGRPAPFLENHARVSCTLRLECCCLKQQQADDPPDGWLDIDVNSLAIVGEQDSHFPAQLRALARTELTPSRGRTARVLHVGSAAKCAAALPAGGPQPPAGRPKPRVPTPCCPKACLLSVLGAMRLEPDARRVEIGCYSRTS